MEEKWICSKEEASIIWYTSWSSLVGSSIQYFYYETHDLSIGTFMVLLTSLLYWRKPTYGYRRTIDMTTVFSVFLYYMYRSFYIQKPYGYYLFTGLSIYSYYISWCKYDNNKKESAYYHALIHVFANIANLLLSANSYSALE